MAEQADTALDPFEKAIDLIANSSESDEEGQVDGASDQDEEEPTDDDPAPGEKASGEKASEATVVEFAGQKFAIPDGTPPDLVESVKEVGKSLQADYTRKTQELVSREQQAAELVSREYEQGKQQVEQAIQQAYAVMTAFGGVMSPQELAQLAQTDQSEWVKQSARQQQLQHYLNDLHQRHQAITEQHTKHQEQQKEAAKQQAWQRLNSEGIDRDALAKLWSDAKNSYEFLSDERLSNVLDAESWLVLRDAIAYRQLKASKPGVTAKVTAAPRLPEGKKPMSKEDRAFLDSRKSVMRRGGARIGDLAAFIDSMNR